MQLLSVNVGQAQPVAAKNGQTGIFKRPTTQPVQVNRLGLVGDHIQDTKHHGGPEQAVYVFTQPDYEYWSTLLGTDLAAGTFGENLLISELESAGLAIGTQLRVGAVLLEITSARIPCATLAARMDDPQFVKKFREVRRPGFYARVLEEGAVSVGGNVTLERMMPQDTPSVLDAFEFFYTKAPTHQQITRLLNAPIHHKLRADIESRLAKLPA